MGPEPQDRSGQRPRNDYKPRELINAEHFASTIGTAQEAACDLSLPDGWEILWPNRIKEFRERAGIPTCVDLGRSAGHISYQRLARLESGQKKARGSELELLANPLGCHPHDLNLPPLTREETVEWRARWGRRQRVSGGDHDAVILAAYMRKVIADTGLNRNRVMKKLATEGISFSGNIWSAAWYAEKPIDRWPDSFMLGMMRLTGAKNWDEVILASRAAWAKGQLTSEIQAVREPRVRLAPDDPDRRAPWTYITDPFRKKTKGSEIILNAYTTSRKTSATKIAKQAAINERNRRIDQSRSLATRVTAWTEQTSSLDLRLKRLFPNERDHLTRVLKCASTAEKQKIAIRARVLRASRKIEGFSCRVAAQELGMSTERLRQLTNGDVYSLAGTGMLGKLGDAN